LDDAGNKVTLTTNVTRSRVEAPPEGILGASIGISAVLILVMLVMGLAILYPGTRAQALEPEAMTSDAIVDKFDADGKLIEQRRPEDRPLPPPPPPEEVAQPTRPLPPPPPPPEEGAATPRRPLPPPPPDQEPGEPPVPPWRR
jgi:hypothetical protein